MVILMLPDRVKKILDEITSERLAGASYLAKKAAEAYIILLKDEAFFNRDYVKELSEILLERLPSVASVYNIAAKMLHMAKKVQVTRNEMLRIAEEYFKNIEVAREKAAKMFLNLVREREITIITHSYSAAVLSTLKELKAQEINLKVILTESRPDFEGIQLANALDKLEITYEIITDAQIGLWVKEADMAITGADCVTRDLYVINKAGTFLLALSARYYGVPFYVVAEEYKFHPIARTGDEIKLMERPLEVSEKSIRNILFDVTPPELINVIVTEKKIIKIH